MDKILFIQFADSMYKYEAVTLNYYNKFFYYNSNIGYTRSKYNFELPKWIAEICFFAKQYKKHICWCEHDLNEINNEILSYKPDFIIVSMMDCNEKFINKLVHHNNDKKFIIGGYNQDSLNKISRYTNVKTVDTMSDVADVLSCQYEYGTDYSLFINTPCIPRLTLSLGCNNHCSFCLLKDTEVLNVRRGDILQQVLSFRSLQFELIYIDDKTFGQADNWPFLKELFVMIKQYNPKFKGFVIQTTAKELISKYKEFANTGVVVAEIGLETYNDNILVKYHKPSSESLLRRAVAVCADKKIKLVMNIVVGFPEETDKSYQNTYDFLYSIDKNILIGINPAMYTDYTDTHNKTGELSFRPSNKIRLHKKWWKIFNNFFDWK